MINKKLYDLIYNSKNDVFSRHLTISSGQYHGVMFQRHINSSIVIRGNFNNTIFDAKFNSYEQLKVQFDKKKDFAMLVFLTLMFIVSKKFGTKKSFYCKYLEEYPKENNTTERMELSFSNNITPIWTSVQPNHILSETLTTVQDTRMERVEDQLRRLNEAIEIFSESLSDELRRRYEAANGREN